MSFRKIYENHYSGKIIKIYPISSVQNGNINFREMLFQQVTFLRENKKEEVFYALKDVSHLK